MAKTGNTNLTLVDLQVRIPLLVGSHTYYSTSILNTHTTPQESPHNANTITNSIKDIYQHRDITIL